MTGLEKGPLLHLLNLSRSHIIGPLSNEGSEYLFGGFMLTRPNLPVKVAGCSVKVKYTYPLSQILALSTLKALSLPSENLPSAVFQLITLQMFSTYAALPF